MAATTLDRKMVAAVCGAEVRIYGPQEPRQTRRALVRVETHNNGGQALYAAKQFDETQQQAEKQRRKSAKYPEQ